MKKMLHKKRFYIIYALILFILISSVSKIFYKNHGTSISEGGTGKVSLKNAYLLPYRTRDFRYFSYISYFILGRAYVHSALYASIKDCYSEMHKLYPNRNFYVMECSRRQGGKMFPHRTHQNGLSIDFMTPYIKKSGKAKKIMDHTGIWHYLYNADSEGYVGNGRKIQTDFNLIAHHLLILNKSAKRNGLKIRKVILKINLTDDLFKTAYGKQLKQSGIEFAKYLPEIIDKQHDDHYHVDFVLNN